LTNEHSVRMAQQKKSLDDVIVKVTSMVSYDSTANKLAKKAGLNVQYVSWEDCARNKGSSWGPCISDMTLRVNNSCMPVIRKPNFSDETWDVKMGDIPIVVGNHSAEAAEALQTISLSDYLANISDFMTNDTYRKAGKQINLLSQKESKDSHVIMSTQACFLPIIGGEETKFNVALYNYQSQPSNPAVLVIVSTSKGSSAQIIEGREQHLLFNNNSKKADFVGERVSDVRKKKGQKNVHDKKLSKKEKQDNVIVVVQVPLKQKVQAIVRGFGGGFGDDDGMVLECCDDGGFDDYDDDSDDDCEEKSEVANVEAAMVSVADRTKPICVCGQEMQKYQVQFAYGGGKTVRCNGCRKSVSGKEDIVYHCPAKSYQHPNGYDLCLECAEQQLRYDELRGIIEHDAEYVLERNEDYPVRVTLQYYKATDNGVVNKEIMDDLVKQLEASQKQADFMGSLVTEYNPNRPTEWVNQDDAKDDPYCEIRAALREHCGNHWQEYAKNFEEQEVTDMDLENLGEADFKELIPKIGPRNKFKKWVAARQ